MGKLGLGLMALSCGAFAGCTAVLGTFEVSGAGTGTDGGGGDATTETGAPADAGADADADPADFLLKCSVDPGSVRVLDTAPTKFDRMAVVRTGQVTRVVTRKDGEGGFRVYSYDPKSPGSTVDSSHPDTENTRVLDVKRTPGGMTVLTAQTIAGGAASDFYLRAWIYPETVGAPSEVALSTVLTMSNSDKVNGVLVPMGSNDEYVVFANEQTQTAAALRHPSGALAAQTLKPFASGITGGAADLRYGAAAAAKVFVFDGVGPEPGKPEGTGFYMLPDDPNTIAGNVAKRLFSPGGGKPHMVFGAASGATTLTLFGAELDMALGAKTPVVMKAGEIPPAKLGSFNGSDLPVIGSFDSLQDVPFFDGAGATFHNNGEDAVAIGAVPGGQGANFYWYNVPTKQLRARQGTGNRLLASRTLERVAIAFQSAPGGPFATFDVAWTEVGSNQLGAAVVNCLK